jgi:hypothetical protein
MQNLSGKSMVIPYKSCSVFHMESNKIEFAFLWFFYNFLCIFQDSAKHIHYLRSGFSIRSLEVFETLQIGPCFALRPLERTWVSQLGPRAPVVGGPAKFRRTGSVTGRARTEGDLQVTLAPFPGLLGAEGRPAGGLDGAAVWRPPGARFRWRCGEPEATGGTRALVRSREEVRGVCRRWKWAGQGARRRPLMATGGGARWGCTGVRAREEEQAFCRHDGWLLLTVNSCIKVRLDLQTDKSPVVIKGPFFPRVVNPRYRIRGTMCNARIQSSKAR